MSRRRGSYQPHVSPTADDLARRCYGERARRDAADLTAVPGAADFDPWLAALRGLVLSVGGFALVIAVYVTALPWLARGW